jgi:hypothetical protein
MANAAVAPMASATSVTDGDDRAVHQAAQEGVILEHGE